MKRLFVLILTILTLGNASGQDANTQNITRKKIKTLKVDQAPKIDGVIDETIWENIPIATGFIERSPNNGKLADEAFKTEFKMAYNNLGLFIAIQMYDPEPSKIATELTERDNIANDDFVGFAINGYNDKQQSLEFLVTAAGVQYDAKLTDGGEDGSWNGIWHSAAVINDKGWSVEVMIPFSELRFPEKEVQEWGLNIFRKVQRTNTFYDWNFVDNKNNSYTLFDGVLEGIENIDPPTRLSFMPYLSSYVNHYDGKTTTNFNGGMDVKFGLNDAFTFDMTLIPDFGQASFDNSILNLTPFEQQFSEQRPFFTEGTELFSKGNLFYSRRVGGDPSSYPKTLDNETVMDYPSKVKLLNAFKISGRTNKGLGVGFFNAVTQQMEATIQNNVTGASRKEVVEPWGNYNVLVFDQRFNDNSSVTLINTNTFRGGSFRDANATGLLWSVNNKKNTYNYYGSLKGSWVMDGETKFGSKNQIGFGKIEGKHRFDLNANFTTRDWDINDLGFSTTTNFGQYNAWYGYRLLQPNKKFNKIFLNFNANYVHRLSPFLYNNLVLNHNNQFTDKNFRNFGFGIEATPFGTKDIYEPRTEGRFLQIPSYVDTWVWLESDSRKKLQYNISLDYYAYNEKGRNLFYTSFILRYRFSDKFKVFINVAPSFSNNETGFAGKEGSEIYIGKRQRNTLENSITSQYTFNNKMALSLAYRHYFSDVTYKEFFTLDEDGQLTAFKNFNNNLNGTYNAWNIDLRYSWWFAPGSQLTILYRNASQNYLQESRLGIKNNYDRLFQEPFVNNLSLKLTYYIDYNRAKDWFKSH